MKTLIRTAHEIVDDWVYGAVEVAHPVRHESQWYGGLVRQIARVSNTTTYVHSP